MAGDGFFAKQTQIDGCGVKSPNELVSTQGQTGRCVFCRTKRRRGDLLLCGVNRMNLGFAVVLRSKANSGAARRVACFLRSKAK